MSPQDRRNYQVDGLGLLSWFSQRRLQGGSRFLGHTRLRFIHWFTPTTPAPLSPLPLGLNQQTAVTDASVTFLQPITTIVPLSPQRREEWREGSQESLLKGTPSESYVQSFRFPSVPDHLCLMSGIPTPPEWSTPRPVTTAVSLLLLTVVRDIYGRERSCPINYKRVGTGFSRTQIFSVYLR